MLKIKVNIDKKSYQTLLNDMSLFKVIKPDGSVNKNRFMNLLFENYYEEYLKQNSEIIATTKALMNKFNIHNDELAVALAMDLYNYKYKSIETYYNDSITFYLSEKNEFIFNTLNESLNSLGASAYFRHLIYRYLEYPQYKREEIIYKPIVDSINMAIKEKRKIRIKLNNSTQTIIPYRIGFSKEEIYSYLLGMANNGAPMSIHILKIKAIVVLGETYSLDDDTINLLQSINRLGIQFPFKNFCEAEIVLSEAGVSLFEAKYLNRPTPIKVVDNHYFFKCSYDQLFVYFIGFGDKVKIISPIYLAKSIYKSYKGYTDEYEKIINTNEK